MLGTRELRFDKHMNKDVVLCVSTNHRASTSTIEVLNEDSISYSLNVKRVPFYRRREYHGAATVCVISINRNLYHRARRSLDRIDPIYRRRLQLNVI